MCYRCFLSILRTLYFMLQKMYMLHATFMYVAAGIFTARLPFDARSERQTFGR